MYIYILYIKGIKIPIKSLKEVTVCQMCESPQRVLKSWWNTKMNSGSQHSCSLLDNGGSFITFSLVFTQQASLNKA